MKKAILLPSLCILFILLPLTTLSQSPQQMPGINEPINIEKLYLHTDRQYYFLGDSLWLKGYYLNGRTQQLSPGFCKMYLELINDTGEVCLGSSEFVVSSEHAGLATD